MKDRGRKNNRMSRRIWEVMVTKTRKTRMEETRRRRKEKSKERKKERKDKEVRQ